MAGREVHMKFWVQELIEFGVMSGPNGEALDTMEYYDLRAFLLQHKLRRDLEPKASPWF